MAYTKIHAIKQTLSKAMNYIENPEKTENQLLVSAYNVDPLVASIEFEMTAALAAEMKGNYKKTGGGNNLAYHMIQSFSPTDNVTPEQAHEIGRKLAGEFLDDRYEYVISTHIDKGHIHNHIIFNSYSFYDLKKMNTQPYKTAAKIRAISDRLCSEYNLSVIKENQEMGHSYKEWSERKKNTSWKSEIRKRLHYILEKAISYEEFLKLAAELGVTVDDHGKHIKYQITGQKNYTRGNKLSDTGDFLKDGILEKVNDNKENQLFLKNLICETVKESLDYETFRAALKEKGITFKQSKTGETVYTIDGVLPATVKESALGNGYSSAEIMTFINTRNYETLEQNRKHIAHESIADEFNSQVRTKVEECDTRVLLKKENILKITVDGLLIEMPEQSGQPAGKIFIDNFHVDKCGEDFEIYLGSKYNYYLVNEVENPDILLAAQLSGKYIKGEDLIRTLELKNGAKAKILDVAENNILTVSTKGITITLPDAGIGSIFIESRYVSYDKVNGSCRVALYDDWNYSFRKNDTDNDKQNELQNIIGQNLAEILSARELRGKGSQTLINKIEAVERKNAISDTKKLAEVLRLLRNEEIAVVDDFELKIGDLQEKLKTVNANIQTLREKNNQYKTATKYLLAYKKYLPIQKDLLKQNTFKRKRFESKYDGELAAFHHAAEQLQKAGVNENVDSEKVIALVKEQEIKITELAGAVNQIKEKIMQLREAKNIVQTLQTDKNNHLDQKRKKEREDER